MKADLRPSQQFDLSAVHSVGATGSPLPAEAYLWVYEHVKEDLMLAVISGGTDPGACFLTCCPVLPVYAGEMQCRELGVATFAYDDAGNEVVDEVGELVMTQPIPCMPIKFWNDHDGSRYHEYLASRRLAAADPTTGRRDRHHLWPFGRDHQSSRHPHGHQRDLPGRRGRA